MTRNLCLLLLAAPLSLLANPTITTSMLPSGSVGDPYSVQLTASGVTGTAHWTQMGGLPPGLSLSDSGLLSGTPTMSSPEDYPVNVTVTDDVGSDMTTLYVYIGFGSVHIQTTSLPDGAVSEYYEFQLESLGGGGPTWSATGLPAGLMIDPPSGIISGTPTSAGTSMVTITADDGETSDMKMLSLTIQPALAITTSSLPTGTIGQPYSFQMMATGGIPPLTWMQANLPAGLTMNSSGLISGTPTSATTAMVDFSVQDSQISNEATLSLTIQSGLSITTNSLPHAVAAQAYSFTLAATGGTGPYSWAISGFPDAIVIDSQTGQLSGTPFMPMTYPVTVTVTDSMMNQDSKPLTFVVDQAAIVITPSSFADGTVSQSYNVQFSASGGFSPYTWTITGLPPGLMSNSAGLVSGTPTTAGTYNVSVKVDDDLGNSKTAPYTLKINGAALSITTSSLPDGTVSQAYSKQLAASGGTQPYTWMVTGLPAGLTASSGGLVSGTPTTAGSYNVSVTVTDANMLTDTAPLTLSIKAGPPQISTTSLPNGTVGEAYSKQLAASGGTAPYTWSATGLPAGLTIDASGLISGSPTAQGTSTISVMVTDAAQATDSRPLSLTIDPAPVILSITTASLPDGMVKDDYAAHVKATSGTPPYTFSFSSGAPPPGLAIASDGAISGKPTTAGQYTFGVDVTDADNNHASKQYAVTIVEQLRFLSDAQLPSTVAGQAYAAAISVAGGTPPYVYQFGALEPPGFKIDGNGLLTGMPPSPGPLSITIQVLDQKARSITQVFELTVSAAGAPFQTSTPSLSFTAAAGGDPPPAQSITIVPGDAQQRAYAVTAETIPANSLGSGSGPGPRAATPDWLSVDPADGVIPARFTVAVNPAGLAAGPYAARLTIAAPNNSTLAPATVTVSFLVESQTPDLDVPLTPVKFEAQVENPGAQDQFITIRNRGGGGPIPFTASVVGGSSWIKSITPNDTQTAVGNPVLVHVRVDTTGLSVGQYSDAIRFSSGGQSVDVPVRTFVSSPGPQLDLSVDGVQFRIRQGNGIATSRRVDVINRGNQGTTLHWTAEILQGLDWLDIPANTGTTIPGDPGTFALRLKSGVEALQAGLYYGLVRVSDTMALNSPQYLSVMLLVVPSTSPTLLDFETAGAVLQATPGSTQLQTTKFTLGASSAAPVAFQAAASMIDGDGWLSVTPASGAVSSTTNAEITVTADASQLAAGIYRGEIVLARANAVRSLNITFIVADALDQGGAPPAASPPARTAAAGCVPGSMALTQTGLPNHFAVPASWPATLILNLNDNCGRPVRQAAMTASFTNGDPPVSLLGDDTGTYSATWQPGNVGQQVNVTVRATADGLAMSSTLLIGDVGPNVGPVLNRNGTAHNLNPAAGVLSPGVVASLYGSGMAGVTESTGAVPLVTEYKQTSVRIGPYEKVPLYFVSPGQINVQLPAELDPNQEYPVVVSANGALTIPDSVTVVPVAPGVAAFGDGRLIAQHSDYTLVDDQNPAKRGEYLVMYLVGLGATDPMVPSGAPSPSDTLAVPLVPPTLTIDGQPVQIAFAGLTPGGVGLFQINFQVPTDARTGVPLEVVVQQDDATANKSHLTVVE